MQKKMGCSDSKAIRLRRDIERKIIFYYKKYSNDLK